MYVEDYGWLMNAHRQGPNSNWHSFNLQGILDVIEKEDLTYIELWYHGEYQLWMFLDHAMHAWAIYKYYKHNHTGATPSWDYAKRTEALAKVKELGLKAECS
jgi:hypothetical protein